MRNLFERLPYDSETIAEIGEFTPEYRKWEVNTYMLANIIDGLNYVAWTIMASNSKKGHAPKKPKPLKRPEQSVKPAVPAKKRWPGKTKVVPKKKVSDANG